MLSKVKLIAQALVIVQLTQNHTAALELVSSVHRVLNVTLLIQRHVVRATVAQDAQVTLNVPNFQDVHNVVLELAINAFLEIIVLAHQSQHHNAAHISAQVVQVIVAATTCLINIVQHILAQIFVEFANLMINVQQAIPVLDVL